MTNRELITKRTAELAKTLNIVDQLKGMETREALLEIGRRFECARVTEGAKKCQELVAILDRN